MMIYDVIWGNVDLQDNAIIKVIKHNAIQRLKRIWISTYGYLFDLKRNATRYDHSIGVYLLLKNFGASQMEQIAGLIHDVSHTALSHVSTYAFQGKYTGTEFHELQHKQFIESSGLSKLLLELGFDSNQLLHDSSYSLLENDLPDICADRIDYALRDGLHLQILSRQQVDQVLKSLKTHNKEFIFTDVASAFLYSFNFYLLNLMYYGSPAEAHFNNDFGNLVKYAVKNKILEESDWFTDDVILTNKLKESKNKQVQKGLAKYNNKLIVYEDAESPDFIFPKKIRIVDPKVLVNNKIKRLTELSPEYKKLIQEYQKNHTKHELPVKIAHKLS